MCAEKSPQKGLVIVNTGSGKGKTTAALGILFRVLGHEMKPCMIQFMKKKSRKTGEMATADRLGIEWHALGEGFSWESKDIGQTILHARAAWDFAREKIEFGGYGLVILDEFTYLLSLGWLDTGETVAWLRAHKPTGLHLVITGRDAPQALVDYADLVTEMTLVKHPYAPGVLAHKGIEF